MAAGGAGATAVRGRPNKWHTLIATCLGLGMLMIDTFVVNVAFPAIGRDLNADLTTAEWTVSAYVLVVGVFPVAMGRLGDIFGRRRVYLAGLAVFVVASVLCGLAQNIEQLVAARVLQGLGAATMFPGTLSIITSVFPPQQRGQAIGIWGGVSGLGLIAGPVLGGLLVRGDDWRWIFFVNLPVGLIALAMAALFVPESRDEDAPRSVDWLGTLLLCGGLFGLMLGLTRGNEAGWGSPTILACWALGAALLAAFVAVERRMRYPLVDLSLFKSVTFVMACLSAFLFSAAVFGSQPYMSLFMQNYWGFSPLEGGLAFLPATALVALLMPVSGIMGQRLGPRLRLIVIGGSLAVLVSALYLLRLTPESGYADGLLPAFLIRGLGIGLVMSSTSLAVMSAVPLAKAGLASGTQTMARNIGTAVGVALFGAVFLNHVDAELPSRLASAPPEQAAQVTAAAEHFVPAGEDEARLAASEVIVDGFIRIAAWTVIIAGLATGAAFFIRHRVVGAGASVATATSPGPSMPTTIERIAAIMRGELPPPPIAQLLGFGIAAVERGRVVLRMEAGPRHANPMGTLHGGVFCDLADGAMGMAYATTLEDDETFTTLELKINFLRPVWNATLTAEGRVVQSGKSVGLVECSVTDERGRLVARATSTCMTLRGEKAEGRRAVYDAAAAG